MKTITSYINESLKIKKELSEFEHDWLDWLYSKGKEGKISNTENVKDYTLKMFKRYGWDVVEEYEDRCDYYFLQDVSKLINKNKLLFNIDFSKYNNLNKIYKYIKDLTQECYDFEEVLTNISIENSEVHKLYNAMMVNTFFSNFYKEAQTSPNGLLKIVRSISLPKDKFLSRRFKSYREWIDTYFDGLGLYWSFSQGGVYCFQSFDSNKMIDGDNQVTIDIYAYVPSKSIDYGATIRQLQGNFSTELEITLISDSEVEVYKVIVKDDHGTKMKLPLKSSIICKV